MLHFDLGHELQLVVIQTRQAWQVVALGLAALLLEDLVDLLEVAAFLAVVDLQRIEGVALQVLWAFFHGRSQVELLHRSAAEGLLQVLAVGLVPYLALCLPREA